MSWIYTTDKMIVLENIGKPGVRGELENKECSNFKLTQKFVKLWKHKFYKIKGVILLNKINGFIEQYLLYIYGTIFLLKRTFHDGLYGT